MERLFAKTEARNFLAKTLAFDGSPVSWSPLHLEEYLRELKSAPGAADVRIKLDPTNRTAMALDWIEKHDPDLKLFSKHHRAFELSRAKGIGIFRMPPAIVCMRSKIQQQISPKVFGIEQLIRSAESADSLQVIEVTHAHSGLRVVLNQTALRPSAKRIRTDFLSDAQKQEIRTQFGVSSTIREVVVSVVTEHRVASIVELDFERGMVTVSVDLFKPADDDKSRPERVSDRFSESLQRVLRAADVQPTNAKTVTDQVLNSSLITAKLARQFRSLCDRDVMSIPHTVVLTHGPERVPAHIECFPAKIRSEAEEHYRKDHDFRGFLVQRPDCDLGSQAEMRRTLQDKYSESETGCSCLFLFVQSVEEEVTDPATNGHRRSRVVDFVNITIDPGKGMIYGHSKTDTAQQIDAVLTSVYRLLSSQS